MPRTTRQRARRLPAEERRQQILDVAIDVFARSGYHGAGTADIAAAAEIGEPTIYRYFDSKADLYIQAVGQCGDRILENWGRIVDSSGNAMVVGRFTGTADFGGGSLTSAGGNDMFVAKYAASSGAHMWSKRFGGTSSEVPSGVAVDQSGNLVVTGYFSNTASFGGSSLTSVGGDDIFVAKYSGSNGNHQWSRNAGSTGSDRGHAVDVDDSGNVVVAGYFSGTLSFNGQVVESFDGTDIFLGKYSSNGSPLWADGFGSTGNDFAYAVATDPDGNIIFTGSFIIGANFGGGSLLSNGSENVYFVKFSPSGGHLWSMSTGDTFPDRGVAITTDSSGNVLAAGDFEGTVDFGGGPLNNSGGNSTFLVKFGP